MNKKAIGIFDSGVGGLTVLFQMLKKLPNEKFIYFGDTARVPYGSKSKETIIHFSRQDVKFLLSKNVKLIVVACNSASSNSMEVLKKEYDMPIFGVIEPTISSLSRKYRKIGIVGTYATIESKSYQKKIKARYNNNVKIYEKSCPLFVPIAEEGLVSTDITDRVIEHYLHKIKKEDIDSLILGCTHYPLFIDKLNDFFDGKVSLINPAKEVTKVVVNYLREKGLENSNGNGNVEFYLSDIPRNFKTIAMNFLNKKIEHVKKIDIERY